MLTVLPKEKPDPNVRVLAIAVGEKAEVPLYVVGKDQVVTGIALTKSSRTLVTGEIYQVGYSIKPKNDYGDRAKRREGRMA